MNLKVRLSVMNFLEFAVWGAYLTSMGNYLGKAGMGAEISWFYAIQGIVSIFMPTLMGIVADKWIQPQRLLGLCHLAAGAGMIALCLIGANQADPKRRTACGCIGTCLHCRQVSERSLRRLLSRS